MRARASRRSQSAGERERATEIVNDIERSHSDHDYWKDWIKATRTFLERDIASVCAEFHAREAATAKELKLGDIWEPSPFPAEVLEAERTTKCADPFFATTPWISRPPGLLQEPPEGLGEVRFAEATLYRDGHVIMLAPLSREAAEEKHRNYQNYTLVARLSGGNLLILSYHTGRNPHDPEQPKNAARVPYLQLNLELHSSSRITRASFSGHRNHDRLLDLYYVDALYHGMRPSIWSCSCSSPRTAKRPFL